MNKVSKGQFLNPNVRKCLFKGAVVECKAARESLTDKKAKAVYNRIFTGKVIKKYRLLKHCKDILPRVSGLKGRKWAGSQSGQNLFRVVESTPDFILKKREAVEKFFLTDDASHFCPGKKDVLTINGEKKTEEVFERHLIGALQKILRKFSGQSWIHDILSL